MSKKIKHDIKLIVEEYQSFITCPKKYDVFELLMNQKPSVLVSEKTSYSILVKGQMLVLMKLIDAGLIKNPSPKS